MAHTSPVPIHGDSIRASLGSSVSSKSNPPVGHELLNAINSLMYPTELNEKEKIWRDRYFFFHDRGLLLRPRYRPDWTASWKDTQMDPSDCEDGHEQILPMVLDATQLRDGCVVCLKIIQKQTDEVAIGQYLCSDKLSQNPKNHCVPIIDTFKDPFLPTVEYIVMPLLRPYNDPEFGAVGEVVDFVTQILEGMAFMHENLVAHGDLSGANIMMDGRPIYPGGWHFAASYLAPNGIDTINPLSRIDHPVRYYIIDYDSSIRFLPGQPHIFDGYGGRDSEVPELASCKPYNPFKMDVFTVGNVFFKEFYLKYDGLDFLNSLVKFMMIRDPDERPTAEHSLQHWYGVRAKLDISIARWRLRKRDESVGERVVLDAVAAARQGIHSMRRLFNGQEKTWSNP